MKHGSLFSGIGGFDLAAEWMGWENVFHCEWNPFGQKVLKHYWPKAESFNDITNSDFTKYANQIDILTGGFPCQPYSSAGQRKGKEDERHLWPHMLRAIQEISPRYIVGENVRGLLNWNGGMVFDEVCVDLENNGYQVAPVVIPACGVNAPHRRERIWFIATNTNNVRLQHTTQTGNMGNSKTKTQGQRSQFAKSVETNGSDGVVTNSEFKSTRSDGRTNNETKGNVRRQNTSDVFGTLRSDGIVTDTGDARLQGREFNRTFNGGKQHSDESHDAIAQLHQIPHWNEFPTQSPVCGRNDGIPRELVGITFSKWRTESIKALGNAVVPQVAFQIFKAIQQCDDSML